VQIRVVAQVDLCEPFEGDIWLAPDAVTTVENPCALARFDVLCLALVGGLSANAVPTTVDAERVVPVMPTARRGRAAERITAAVLENRVATATLEHAHGC
jgi:hypothetical protein